MPLRMILVIRNATYTRSFAGIVAALLLVSCATAPAIAPADLIVVAPRMLDVRSGRYVRDRMVVIRDGRIAEVHPASRARDVVYKDRFVIPRNSILIPGLIDHATGAVRPLPDGMSLVETLRAAAGDSTRERRVGSIEPGFEADLVVISSDVLRGEPIWVSAVISRGLVIRNDFAVQ